MRNVYLVGTALLAMSVSGLAVRADDTPPVLRATPAWSWQGFYAGGHVGAFAGITNFSDPDGTALFGGSVMSRGFLAGL